MARKLVVVTLLVGVAACGDPSIVVPEALSIVTVLPSHGATGIATDVDALVYFSSPLKDTTAAGHMLSIDCLGAPPCNSPTASGCVGTTTVASTASFEINQVAHVVPDAVLLKNTCYEINIGAGIEAADSNIGPLPVDVRSAFETTP
jgi:hypothetical protein